MMLIEESQAADENKTKILETGEPQRADRNSVLLVDTFPRLFLK
jgi:hypothetical protein